MKNTLTLLLVVLISFMLGAQQEKDQSTFTQRKNPFYEKIHADLDAYYRSLKAEEKRESLVMDFSGRNYPTDLETYRLQWHNPPESQGLTSTCWAFSTLSMLESDLNRRYGLQVKLSQMFVVYHEYLEKATRFINTRGESYIAPGSEANAVTRVIKKYGVVPWSAYPGKPEAQPFHDHRALDREIKDFLDGIKKSGNWNLEQALATVRAIMDHYLGTPPQAVTWKGKKYPPLNFSRDVLKLNPEEYVDIISYLQQPFWRQVEYQVPDNWWHDRSYYNLPLEDFMAVLKDVIKSGYTVSIGGDTSEPGYSAELEVGVVPGFDIPRSHIDDHARQFRFSNRTTTDDHGIHIVGWSELDGDTWFVIKDSGSGAFAGKNPGYRFIREDYVKLKWMDFMVHRSAVESLLKKFPSE